MSADLVAFAAKIGLGDRGGTYAPIVLARLVEKRLAQIYPGVDSVECECGFSAPNTVVIPTCPACGLMLGKKKERKMKAQVLPMVKEDVNPVATEAREKSAEAEVRALETKVDAIRKSKVVAEWELGSLLSEISKRDLWRASSPPDGQEPYTSFVDYAQRRFDLSKDTARAYLQIAETFTREEAEDLSISQLWFIAKVPDAKERAKLAKDVKSGKISTARELAAKVKVKRAEAGLRTERSGFEGTVAISARMKPGVLAEGEFKETRGGGGYIFAFTLGGQSFQIKRPKTGKSVQVILMKPT